jgi:hypothetical protein
VDPRVDHNTDPDAKLIQRMLLRGLTAGLGVFRLLIFVGVVRYRLQTLWGQKQPENMLKFERSQPHNAGWQGAERFM